MSIHSSADFEVASPTASLPEVTPHPLAFLADLLYEYMFETKTWTAFVWYDEPTWTWHHACDEFGNDAHMVIVDMERTIATDDNSMASWNRGRGAFEALCDRYNVLLADFVMFLSLYPAPRPQYRHEGKGKGTVNRILFPGDPRND